MCVFRGGLWGTDAEHLNPTTRVVGAEENLISYLPILCQLCQLCLWSQFDLSLGIMVPQSLGLSFLFMP